jgi:hypothetical protein
VAQPKAGQPFVLLSSSAETATRTSDGFNIPGTQGLFLFMDVTAESATPLITVSIEAKMPQGTTYEQICAFAQLALSGAAQYIMVAAPGLLAAGVNGTNAEGLQCYVPPQFRIVATAADADSATYSVGGWALKG